jgi:hypothetical protein
MHIRIYILKLDHGMYLLYDCLKELACVCDSKSVDWRGDLEMFLAAHSKYGDVVYCIEPRYPFTVIHELVDKWAPHNFISNGRPIVNADLIYTIMDRKIHKKNVCSSRLLCDIIRIKLKPLIDANTNKSRKDICM